MTEDELTVDDLVTGRAAEQLPDGEIPTAAVLVVETIHETGRSLRYVLAEGMVTHQAIGTVRSVLNKLEADDLANWGDDDE